MNNRFIHVEPDILNPGYYLCTLLDRPAIAELITAKRGFRTQSDVASALFLTEGAIRHYESAREIPNVNLKPRIAEFYHMSVQELFFDHIKIVRLSAAELKKVCHRWPSWLC
jgi:DNA-binding XRE family transcriptional regulator